MRGNTRIRSVALEGNPQIQVRGSVALSRLRERTGRNAELAIKFETELAAHKLWGR